MAQYSHRTFLRQLSGDLLDEFLRKHEGSEAQVSAEAPEYSIDLFLQRLEALPKKDQRQAEFELRQVFDLATEDGAKALIDEGRFKGKDLVDELEPLDLPDKAMRVLLAYPLVFRVASRIYEARRLNAKHWHVRNAPIVAPDVTQPNVAQMGRTISKIFWKREGRGKRSMVERYLVNDTEHFIFVYLDDYARNYLGFDDTDKLIRRAEKRAFEVVYIYNVADGSLNLNATGDKKLRESLFEVFATTVLGTSLPPDNQKDPYAIGCLKSKLFRFPTDPADGIDGVRVRDIRVFPAGWPDDRITLEAGGRGSKADARAMVETYLDQKRLPLDDVRVSKACLEFRLAQVDDRLPVKFAFDVSTRSCNLKSLPETQRLLGEKYLRRWKIVGA